MKKISSVLGDINIIPCKTSNTRPAKKTLKDKLVIQHNHLIEARYRLSLQEKRVILWLLTQIKPDDEDFKLHRLEIAEFAKMNMLGINNQYSKLQEITMNLMKRVLKINKPESKSIFQIAWLSYAEYHLKKGYVELRFDPALKPYLLNLKSHFTQLALSDMMQLTSIYSIRFYELLKQYELIKQREISIKELREHFGINDNEYARYNDFKKDILERIKKEINEKTDLKINYYEIKESRKIVAIKWTIIKKDARAREKLENSTIVQKQLRSEIALIESLKEYGFTKAMAQRMVENYDHDIIRNAIHVVNVQIEKKHAKNPKALLIASIKNAWHPEKFKPNKSLL